MESSQAEYSLISPTAKIVAYWRSFADIPYAHEVAAHTDLDRTVEQFFGKRQPTARQMATAIPYVEGRYHCIMREVDRAGIKQVLELASGLSLRGLAVTRLRKDVTYVETDLEGMHQEKMQVVSAITAQERKAIPPNLHLTPANALDWEDLRTSLLPLDPSQPLAIVHEGLAQYLTMDEKRELAKNVHKLLKQFGGLWISPDFESLEAARHHGWDEDDAKAMADAIALQTKRHFEERSFASEADVAEFFASLGFAARSVPMLDESIVAPPTRSDDAKGEGPALIWDRSRLRLWLLSVRP